MEQQNIKAYLDLVQQLLSCRQGEEWIVLRQNEPLVNVKLIEVMEQVANYLTVEGEINGARYLHNWAGKLHHILTQPIPSSTKPEDKTPIYTKLIEALLSCRQGEEQGILQANQALITPQLVTLMRQVATQSMQQGNPKTAEYLNNLATAVSRTWIQTHHFQPSLTKANQLAPDPWEDSPPPAPAPVEPPPPTPEPVSEIPEPVVVKSETPVVEKIVVKPEPSPKVTETVEAPSESSFEEKIVAQMQAIATTLANLEKALTTRLKPANPLEYLVILEQAAVSGWLISSTEVEQLIGIHPHCPKDETSFDRGNWRFVKEGKLGLENAWRVEKINH